MRRSREMWWTVVVALGAVTAGLSLVDGNAAVALVQAGAPMLAVVGFVLAAVLAWRRRWWRAATSAAAAAVLVAPVLAPRPTTPETGGRTLSVLAVNTYNGEADPDVLMAEIDARAVDVVVLPEMTDPYWAALVRRGITERFPHATGRTGGGPGMVVATREPVECLDLPAGVTCGAIASRPRDMRPRPDSFDQITVRLPDGTVVRGVHLWSPRLLPLSRWREDQGDLQRWIDSRPEDEPLILAGDFNAGRSHPVFRSYSAGFDDSPRNGVPWTRTWPVWGPIGPFAQIDHVLARGWRAQESETVRVPGSDHRAVWTRLTR